MIRSPTEGFPCREGQSILIDIIDFLSDISDRDGITWLRSSLEGLHHRERQSVSMETINLLVAGFVFLPNLFDRSRKHADTMAYGNASKQEKNSNQELNIDRRC